MASMLIVDDEPDIRRSLRAYLAAHLPGTEVVEAAHAREALELARTRRIDVVLTDFLMPGMDGLELLSAWQQIQPGSRGMLLTAYPDASVAARAVQRLGSGNVFAKPIDPWQVVLAAARQLGVQAVPDWVAAGKGVPA